ncbi:MAG TPA: carbohydrate ABC transporter permease [Candidatus Limnocylindria bacterium]|nr:carbohydrate ABC transporter permease [Candidatus Limnocylindria bacterium]
MGGRALEIVRPRRPAWLRLAENVPIHVFFIVAGVLWAIPAIGLLVTSFRPLDLFTVSGWWTAFGGPHQLSLANYHSLFASSKMAGSFVNSVLIAVPATVMPVVLATMAAYAFTWLNFPGRTALFLLLIALMVVPLQMALIPIAQVYAVFGPPGIVRVFLFHAAFAVPYATFLFRNFFLGIPHELLESARMDGARDARIFTSLILPLAFPAIASFAVFQFLWVWNDLLVGLVFAGNTPPVTVAILEQMRNFGSSVDVISAASFLSLIPPLLLFFAFQRYFVQGLLAGSVKG